MNGKRKDNLLYAASERFYELQKQLGAYPEAFAFRQYAAVVAFDGKSTYSVSLFGQDGKFIGNIAA